MFPIVLQSLEEIIWMTMPYFYVMGWVMITAMPIVLTLFWKKWMPRPARTLFWAGRRKTPPLILCHDSGRGELTTITERKGEGIVVTALGKYKILPRWLPKLPYNAAKQAAAQAALPMPETNSTSVEAEGQDPPPADPTDDTTVKRVDVNEIFDVKVLKEHFILDYSDWTVKRTSLLGLDMPLWFGYTGKLCLFNPEALALYEAGEMFIRNPDAPNGVMFNPNNVADKKLENALQPLLLLDPRKIQQIIYDGYDQSQIAGVVADSEEIARLGQGLSPKMKMLLGIAAIGILAVLAIFFLPQLLGGGNKQPQQTGFVFSLVKLILRR